VIQKSAGICQRQQTALGKREKGKDANGREKIGMLMRLLETIHLEVSRVLSEVEDNPAKSAVPKETEAEISEGAQRNFTRCLLARLSKMPLTSCNSLLPMPLSDSETCS